MAAHGRAIGAARAFFLVLTLALVLAACARDETLSGYAMPGAVHVLAEIDGAPPPYRATLRLPRQGRVTGTGPCNAFSARQSVPYPWIAIEDIVTGDIPCAPALEQAETAYLSALSGMTLAEVSGPVLMLSDETGRTLVFRAE